MPFDGKITYIYVLINPFLGNIFYCGKTINPWKRLNWHLNDAKLDRGCSKEVRRYIKKILDRGEEPRFKVVYTVKVGEDWEQVEKDFIAYYRSKYDLLNSSDGGWGHEAGKFHLTEEQIDHLRKINSKALYCYDSKTGKLIQEYPSASVAARKLNLFSNQITQVAKRKITATGGYIFRYKTEGYNERIPVAKTRGKDVLQLDINGNLIKRWSSGHLAASELNLNHSAIMKTCKGKQKVHANFVWKFA